MTKRTANRQLSMEAFFPTAKSSSSDPNLESSKRIKTSDPSARNLHSDSPDAPEWFDNKSVLIGKFGVPNKSAKIAAFDLDSTLIKVKSKYKRPVDENDWVFHNKNVVKVLRSLHTEGYHITVISNQRGLKINSDKERAKKLTRKSQLKTKISNIAKQLDIPFYFYAATANDFFRKPGIGLWHLMSIFANDHGQKIGKQVKGIMIHASTLYLDLDSCFYVGDAVGRPDNWRSGVPKDFADTDLKFALNANIKIYTPEEYFENATDIPKIEIPQHPKAIVQSHNDSIDLGEYDGDRAQLYQEIRSNMASDKMTMVVMVGSPASGKSTLVINELVKDFGFERINQVNNTNPNKASRASFIAIGKKYGAKVYSAHVNVPKDLVKHNIAFRSFSKQAAEIIRFLGRNETGVSTPTQPTAPSTNKTAESQKTLLEGNDPKNMAFEDIFNHLEKTSPATDQLSIIAIHSFFSKFELPTKKEGFDNNYVVLFEPYFGKDGSTNSELASVSDIWHMYLE
ncbi:Bifunctional polynucleotide phosphatase/kinase [Zancudomyces culisetae]|uniref:Bifunctional polynucleotide phosphatase/kinase n=1 Tax=Zancudomyces culisetae TaxID=1213189 RepID=A0A1R1PZ90_ZANCU|nr:Bifunctional polynucleotide phosphatase/kinase [Zancudomyces culisetae]|eukprot:OMH86270.1 Bifunctional polynucleotide phosphatase/kinase [Zancudomyces culisetae]